MGANLQAEIKRYVPMLVEHIAPEKIILFGSLATDEVHLWSDIDMVIVAQTEARFLDRSKEMLKLLQPTVGLDILVYTPAEFEEMVKERPFFQQEILAKGKVLLGQ